MRVFLVFGDSSSIYGISVVTGIPQHLQNMSASKRKNTLAFYFDKETRRIQPSRVELDDWLTEVIGISIDSVHTIQLDQDEYCVFVKFYDPVTVDKILSTVGRSAEFLHRNGAKSRVAIKRADTTYRTVRVLNLPIEIDNEKIREVLCKYGEVKEIINERWGPQYKLQCFSGVRSVDMEVKTNIPSHITVDGCKAHVIYTGQTPTCHVCNESGHFRSDCPRRVTVLKTNLTLRRKLTLNEVLSSDKSAQSEIEKVNTNGPENLAEEINEFPVLKVQQGSDPVLHDNEIQNKKRPHEQSEDHSDEEISCKSPAIRKPRASGEEQLIDDDGMQIDPVIPEEKLESPVDSEAEEVEQERVAATSAAASDAQLPPQSGQPEVNTGCKQEVNSSTQRPLSKALPQVAARGMHDVGPTVPTVTPASVLLTTTQSGGCITTTSTTKEPVISASHVAITTQTSSCPPTTLTAKQPVTYATVAATPIQTSGYVTTTAGTQEGRRRKLKPQPNLTVPRNVGKTKPGGPEKTQKNISYEIVQEYHDDDHTKDFS